MSKLQKMRNAGQAIANLFPKLDEFLKPGLTKNQIDLFCKSYMDSIGARSAAFGYKGYGDIEFPNYSCISVNNEVCHAVSNNYTLKEGDIVSIDSALILDDHYGDSCYTFIIKKPRNPRHKKLVEAAYNAMWNAIESIVPNQTTVGDLGFRMEQTAIKYGFSIVKDYCGHGVGTSFHEEPQIPFYGIPGTGEILRPGMFITIEPMVNEGKSKTKVLNDGWTAVTTDGFYSAQFEHTVYVSEKGYEVTTFNEFDKKNEKNKIKFV